MFTPNVLVMDWDHEVRQDSVYEYFMNMDLGGKAYIASNGFDLFSDIFFASNMFDKYPCIGVISGASFVLSSSAFTWSTMLDYKAWQREYDLNERAIVRLRWEVLIVTPVEDIVNIINRMNLFAIQF